MSKAWIKFSSAFDEMPDINHGFFTNNGGVSGGIYKSLNTGLGSNDAPHNILENRKRVANALGTHSRSLLSMHQYHSTKVLIATQPWPNHQPPKADAMVTNVAGIACTALSADCSPVLLADPVAKIIGAAHAGWRGARAGVTDTAIEAMVSLGAKRANISAAIGPCISAKYFEVGPEFVENFLLERVDNQDLFVPGQGDRSYFDIKTYLQRKLLRAGIANAHALPDCTYSQDQEFFSYRRNCHAGISDYGRNISAIILN